MTTCLAGQQKPTEYCKAITLQLKNFFLIKKLGFWWLFLQLAELYAVRKIRDFLAAEGSL